jgi:glycosyltransferase involved in cell wall biosynthesis
LRAKVISLGVAAEKVGVVLNGVDLAHFRPIDRADCRRRLGLPADRRIAISVGRLTAGKGHHDLIRALPALLQTTDVDLYIVGGVNPEDDFEPVLRALIAELGLESRVHLIEQVRHDLLPCWYGAADLFCLATRREGCPNVVLEALACGTPVVACDVGAVAEFVIPGENGYLVPAGLDPAGWATIMRTALERPWNRELIAAGMKNRDWAHCGKQVLDFYRAVLNAAPKRA